MSQRIGLAGAEFTCRSCWYGSFQCTTIVSSSEFFLSPRTCMHVSVCVSLSCKDNILTPLRVLRGPTFLNNLPIYTCTRKSTALQQQKYTHQH
eukprot:1150706-Pelagomonas_calceolata.AAC.7